MNLFDYVAGGQPLEYRLAQLATSRLSQAFAESTKRVYASIFQRFSGICHLYVLGHLPSDSTPVCFLECLQYNGVKAPQMANYLSAVQQSSQY